MVKAFAMSLLVTGIFSGCANVPEYKIDPALPKANLRIIGVPTKVEVTEAADPVCISGKGKPIVITGEIANSFTNLGVDRKIGIPLGESIPKKVSTEVHIPAGKPFALDLIGVWGIDWSYFGYCKKQVEFLPVADRSYELLYVLKGRGTEAQCNVTLQSIDGANGNYTKANEPSLKVRENECSKK